MCTPRPPIALRCRNPKGGAVPMMSARRSGVAVAIVALAALTLPAVTHAAPRKPARIVVIYQENHSFDNLYGGWERVRGRSKAPSAPPRRVTKQGAQSPSPPQDDVNLPSPPLPPTCHDATTSTPFDSHFANKPFTIDRFIPATAKTCPAPGSSPPNGVPAPTGAPGGCTRDLVHRFYQEQYQLNDGRQNRYVTGSDAVGLTMGHYATRKLPIYRYLHRRGHQHYRIADELFQGAFGGSFLNHQWLVAPPPPTRPNAGNDGSAGDPHPGGGQNGKATSHPPHTPPAGAGPQDGAAAPP